MLFLNGNFGFISKKIFLKYLKKAQNLLKLLKVNRYEILLNFSEAAYAAKNLDRFID